MGLELFSDLACRIPRQEVDTIVRRVRGACGRRFGAALRLEACGSYRRGATSCGDVDVLLCARSADEESRLGGCQEVLAALVAELTQEGFLTHDLKGSRRG